jgi:hypothetical protein
MAFCAVVRDDLLIGVNSIRASIAMSEIKRPSHVVLTSHKNVVFKDRPKIVWGAKTARERGPIVGATIA